MFLLEGDFNPVEHLFDRFAAWVSLWGVHGAEFIKSWNDTMPGFMGLSQHALMMMAAAAIVLVSVSYVTYVRNTRIPRGLRNFIEPIALFVRNEIARPNIKNPHAAHGHEDHGHRGDVHDHEHGAAAIAKETAVGLNGELHGDGHGHNHSHAAKDNPHALADKFAPFLCCTFFFIATVNLLGLIPGSTTATGAITVTLGFALLTFLTYFIGAIMIQKGSFITNLVPYKFSTKPMDLTIWFLLFAVEIIGMLAKPFALTVRLFANMTAGHCIILSLLFINLLVGKAAPDTWWPVATGVPTVLMSVAIYGLEIFVGILQAYIFTYLSAIFIGSYLVPEH